MSDRERDSDAAWLLAREQHRPGPPIPEARAARYARLEALISELPATPVAPHAGWRERTLAVLEAAAPTTRSTEPPSTGAEHSRHPTRRWRTPLAIAALTAVVVIALAVRDRPDGRHPRVPQIAMTVQPIDPSRGEPAVGDLLVVRAASSGNPELRVYGRDGALQASCTVAGPACRIERAGNEVTLIITMPIKKLGVFRAVLYASPLDTSTGVDGDLAAARATGIGVTISTPLTIR